VIIIAIALAGVLAVMVVVLRSLRSREIEDPAVIEGFESYDDDDNRIFDTWLDGFTNDTGSTVGYFEAPFAERRIVRRGKQSMRLEYDNTSPPYYSEASRTWAEARDWTARDANALTLCIRGMPENKPCLLAVGIEDTMKRLSFAAHPDPNILTARRWTRWAIPIPEFANVDVASVRAMYIRMGDPDSTTSGGEGIVYIDDIRLTGQAPSEAAKQE
jgi:hypothetical protein